MSAITAWPSADSRGPDRGYLAAYARSICVIYHGAAFDAWLFVLAFATSIFGSLVGLGGGFILVPLLRLVFGLPPAITAGSSLVLVVTNNAMASIAYFRQR